MPGCSTARAAGVLSAGTKCGAGDRRRRGELLWIHLKRTAPDLQSWLEAEFAIPEPTAELLTSAGNRPRAFRERDTLVAVLRGINFNPGAEPEDMVSMQLWSDGTRLATLRAEPLQTPREVLARIDAGDGPCDAGATITPARGTVDCADEPVDRRYERGARRA